jgi:hypothetical protein
VSILIRRSTITFQPPLTGSTVLADKGFTGREIEGQIAARRVTMLRPDRRNEPTRHGNLGGVRQWIESVFDLRG